MDILGILIISSLVFDKKKKKKRVIALCRFLGQKGRDDFVAFELVFG